MMLLTLQKKRMVVAVAMLYAATEVSMAAQVAEKLYIKDGIQVSRIVKVNPMGGTTIEYVKNRVSDAVVATPEVKEQNVQATQQAQVDDKAIEAAPKLVEQQAAKPMAQLGEENKAEPLYVEDGDIAVSKVVKHNMMGGTEITYVKKRVQPHIETNKPKIATATELNKTQAEKTKPVATPSTELRDITKQLVMAEPSYKTQSMRDIPYQPPRFVIQTEGGTGKERAILAQIKAQKASQDRLERAVRITPVEDLKLSPGEESIRMPGKTQQIVKKATASKKRYKPEDAVIGKLEFNEADMRDVTRALADISGLNFVATDEAAKKKITVFLQNISVKNALEAITKNAGLWYRKDKDSGTFRIMSTKEYQKDLVVYREDITKVYRLHQPNPINVATAIRDLYGARVILSFGAEYDDFFTGQFNSGGGGLNGGGLNGGGNRGGFGGGAGGRNGVGGFGGGGQNNLRRGVTSGVNNNNRGGLNNNINGNQGPVNTQFGSASNGAITEELTVDQMRKIEAATNGQSEVGGDALRSVTKAQQPIYLTVNNPQNMVILRTSDTVAVSEIDALIKEIDQPTPQILLEMQILEVDVGDAYTQLFSFGALSSNGKNAFLGREDAEAANTGKFVYTFIDSLIATKLEILEQTNRAKIVSSPILLASNNRTSRLFVGEERLLIRGATLTDATFNQNGGQLTPSRITYETELRNVGNTLNITPKINADETVTLGIFQDSSTVNEDAVDFPPLIDSNGNVVNITLDTVQTSNIEGVVVAKDGLTVAIGGLINVSKSKRNSKIPILGDLPYIGGLFNDRVESETRSEMVLLITPHIMYEPVETDTLTRDVVEPISVQEW